MRGPSEIVTGRTHAVRVPAEITVQAALDYVGCKGIGMRMLIVSLSAETCKVASECMKTTFEPMVAEDLVVHASNLDDARRQLAAVDGILTEDCFPTHGSSAPEPYVTQANSWAALLTDADRLGKPLVVLTRKEALAVALRERGHVAFVKRTPSDVTEAAQSLIWLMIVGRWKRNKAV